VKRLYFIGLKVFLIFLGWISRSLFFIRERRLLVEFLFMSRRTISLFRGSDCWMSSRNDMRWVGIASPGYFYKRKKLFRHPPCSRHSSNNSQNLWATSTGSRGQTTHHVNKRAIKIVHTDSWILVLSDDNWSSASLNR
jgi:hypothetical protein